MTIWISIYIPLSWSYDAKSFDLKLYSPLYVALHLQLLPIKSHYYSNMHVFGLWADRAL